MSLSTPAIIAYDLFFNKNWRILRKLDENTFVISNAVTHKVIAVYSISSLGIVKNAFTTHHFNDNFTLDSRNFAVENWAFGIGKLIIARYEATQLWNNELVQTRESLLKNLLTMENEVIKIGESMGAPSDVLVQYCRGVLEESKMYEFDSMTTKDLYFYWQTKADMILRLIPNTLPRIAKEGIGRKVPGDLIQPFFNFSKDIVAYLHAYKHSYDFSETAIFLCENMAEEVSKKDDIWAIAINHDGGSLQYFRELDQDEDKRQLVLQHLASNDSAQKKLGQALHISRNFLCNTLLMKPTEQDKEASVYLTKCGFFDFFEKTNRVSLCNLKMQHSNREKDMFNEILSGNVTIRAIFDEILLLQGL